MTDTLTTVADALRAVAAAVDMLAAQQPAKDEKRVRPKDAAAYLGVSRATVTAMMQSGQLKHERFGPKTIRISLAELEKVRKRRQV